MYASLSSNKYSNSTALSPTWGQGTKRERKTVKVIFSLLLMDLTDKSELSLLVQWYCRERDMWSSSVIVKMKIAASVCAWKNYCIHCTCTCNTVWEASWTCPVTVMMITVIIWYTRIAPTVYVFRLENRSKIFTCVVGVDRQLSVSAMCVRYVCLALFKSVLNMLHFRVSHWKLEDLRTTNLSRECQVNCNCLPACENQLPSCWKSYMKLLLMMRYSLFFHLKHNNTWINKVSVWMSPWGEIPVQVKRPSLFFLFSV